MEANKSIRGTRTEKNLANAFISESCAYTRYTFFAQAAQKESYFQVSNVFNETAANELRHAKIFLQYLADGVVNSDVISVDPGILSPTVNNLKVASQEEATEGVEQYIASAKVAEEEGFNDIASHFRSIATIENHHKERFDLLRKRIEEGTMWHRDKPIKWQCLVCGYIFEGTEPPKVCPACNHPYQHFMPMEDNF